MFLNQIEIVELFVHTVYYQHLREGVIYLFEYATFVLMVLFK